MGSLPGQLLSPPPGVICWYPPSCLPALSTHHPLFLITSQCGWEWPEDPGTGCLGKEERVGFPEEVAFGLGLGGRAEHPEMR